MNSTIWASVQMRFLFHFGHLIGDREGRGVSVTTVMLSVCSLGLSEGCTTAQRVQKNGEPWQLWIKNRGVVLSACFHFIAASYGRTHEDQLTIRKN